MSASLSPKKVRAKAVAGAPIQSVEQPGGAHFAMIEKRALANLDELMRQNIQAARLVISLIRLLESGSGGVVIISRQAIKELLQVSMPTVDRCVKLLTEGGWVHRVKVGSAYGFAVNRHVAWVGARSTAEHAVFSATVFAARSEQDEWALNPPELKQLPVAMHYETPIAVGADPEPPSQGLLSGMEPVARAGGADLPDPWAGQREALRSGQLSPEEAYRLELERRGQLRIDQAPGD